MLWLLLTAALVAAAAQASEPAPRAEVPAAGDRVFCTPLGCRGPAAPGSWSHAVGFGAAVLAVGWMGRRQRLS